MVRYVYSMNFLARFWSRVYVAGATDCWSWIGATTSRGYGAIVTRGPRTMDAAHRVSWSLANASPIPAGSFVCHACDNPLCVNPAHLFLGSPADNMRDKVAKGRASRIGPKGEAHADAKLTEADVLEIRRRYREGRAGRPPATGKFQKTGAVTLRSLAADYGVDHTQILRAVRGDQWGHV